MTIGVSPRRGIIIFTFLFTFYPTQNVFSVNADQIIEKVFNSQVSNGFQVEIDLETTRSIDKKSRMRFSIIGKIDKNNSKFILFFNEPADSRGMKLLSINERGADPLLHIFMPGPQQSFQLSGEDLNMQLGDSAATLGDLVSVIPWDGEHTLLDVETCMQESCYRIETKKKWEKGRRITTIGSKTLLSYSIEQFDVHNQLTKKVQTLETRSIGGRDRVTTAKITSYRDKESVTIATLISGSMDLKVPDTLFKPSMLKRSFTELLPPGDDPF